MKRESARPAQSGQATDEEAFGLAPDETEALRRFNETSLQFASTLEQMGPKADSLRREMLALVELTVANPRHADIATAAIERAQREVSVLTLIGLPAAAATAQVVGRQGSFGRAYAARTSDRRSAARVH